MIVDRIESAVLYRGLGERIALALTAVQTPREPGRYELDSDKVFVLVQHYQTKPLAEGKWETHRKYIDVQFVAAGVERIGWTPVNRLALTQPYDEAKDIAFYQGTGDFVTVSAGMFMILFPEDAHMPGIALDASVPVTKAVVKVRVS